MTDPFSPPPEYHVLHDAHLKEFFKNPTMKKRLKDKGKAWPQCDAAGKYTRKLKLGTDLQYYFGIREL